MKAHISPDASDADAGSHEVAALPGSNDELAKTRFGNEVLGPILYFCCHRMWQHQAELATDSSRALFAARGGLRMLALYDLFLTRQGLASPIPCMPFMVSRLAVSKAVWHRTPALVIPEILRAFRNKTWEELGPALLPEAVDANVREKVRELPVKARTDMLSALGIYQVVNGPGAYALALRNHLSEQGLLFEQYLHELAADCRHLVLCDTGIFGSTQLLLMGAYPEYQWQGLYLGRSRYKRKLGPRFGHTSGLFLDRDRFSTRHPESALLHHWHALEMPLEPAVPSVTHYFRQDGKVHSNLEVNGWQESVAMSPNPYYKGIVEYFSAIDRPMPEQAINLHAANAADMLQRKICLPSTNDVRILSVGNRSVDFGFRQQVNVVHATHDDLIGKLRAVRAAIWKEGQIRVEFPIAGGLINRLLFQLGRVISW